MDPTGSDGVSERRLISSLRARREQAGLAQQVLARRAGTSRQTLAAIEAGRAVPGTALALRLAAALECSVEDLFRLPGAKHEVTVPARLVETPRHVDSPRHADLRVRLSMAGGHTVAIPLVGILAATAGLPAADGVVCGRRGSAVRVRLLASRERLADTAVVAGCDPALPVVAAHFRQTHIRHGLTWLPSGSLQALRWLRSGAAHIAGVHLRDTRTGVDNVPLVRRFLGGRHAVVIGFATWEQGFIVAPGNPKGIHEASDLLRPAVTIINREEGSGARAVLDAVLEAGRCSPVRIRGYRRIATSHLAVAQAVALRLVDAGVGVRAAAQAYGMDFVPLRRERYDLVVPAVLLRHPPVDAFLETCRSPAVRGELEALGGYDMSELGTLRAKVP